uniref:Uncharacterized protein n=1 Tax=Anguilla anguilla TaxID=7936 RepID=A0A0E9SNS7_ANGAN
MWPRSSSPNCEAGSRPCDCKSGSYSNITEYSPLRWPLNLPDFEAAITDIISEGNSKKTFRQSK